MQVPLLDVSDLRMIYQLHTGLFSQLFGNGVRALTAVDGIDLRLAQGETLAIVGESGSGKTTTGRLVTLQERPTGGSIWFDGQDITGLWGEDLKRYRRDVQMIFQNPYEALDPRMTIGDSITEPLNLHERGTRAERRSKVEEVLAAVELRPVADFINRFPADLSGGQLQRVAIARALVLEPRLIVADEPVSMLDVSIRSGVMNLMRALQTRLGVSYLYITHDLAVARYMAGRIAVMYLGAVVEEGPTHEVIGSAGHPYTRLLVAAVPDHQFHRRRKRVRLSGDVPSGQDIPPGCRFHTRCPRAELVCATMEPPKVALGKGHWASCHFADEVARTGAVNQGAA